MPAPDVTWFRRIVGAIGAVAAVVAGFFPGWPWSRWIVISACAATVILVIGWEILIHVRERPPRVVRRNPMSLHFCAVALGVVSMTPAFAMLVPLAPWDVVDPTSAQALHVANNDQLRRTASALARDLRRRRELTPLPLTDWNPTWRHSQSEAA